MRLPTASAPAREGPAGDAGAPARRAPPGGTGRRSARNRRRGWRAAAGLASGVLIGLSLPPFGWWPLAWVGFAGLALLLRHAPVGSRLAAGFAVGVGQFGLGIWWVNEFQPAGYVALVALSAAFVAVAAAAVPGRRFRAVAVGLPGTVVLAEWARDRVPLGGFPLGGVALGQARSPLAPVLRLGGGLALTGAAAAAGVILAGAGLVAVAALRRHRRDPRAGPGPRRVRAAIGWEVAAAGLVVAAVVAGLVSPGGGPAVRTIRVALVQGGGRRGTRAVTTDPDLAFARALAASTALRPPLDLVVWPEGVLQSHLAYQRTNGAVALAALARRLHATVVAGVEQDVGTAHYFNRAVAWAPDGRIVASYQKNKLVPFGEYVPDRSLVERFFSVALVPEDAIPGHGPGILHTPAGPLGVMISYEVFFDSRARGAVAAGGQVLVVPTDTASYADTEVPGQELAALILRAWETGRSALQVTPTGYSAVVGPTGRVRAVSGLDRQAVVEAPVALRRGLTVYVRIGDTPVAVLAALAAAASWLPVRHRRRARRRSPAPLS